MKMNTLQDSQGTDEARSSLQVSHKSQTDQQSSPGCDGPIADAAGTPILSNEKNKKISREDIELVQNLIERCLLLYMNRNEVVTVLKSQARIDPGFTSLVWQKLEEENAEFFRAYYIRLKLKKQILLFNNLLEHQYHLMKYPAAPKVPLVPMQNGVHSVPVNNVPMRYPVLQQHTIPETGQPHLDTMGLSSYVVSGVPAPGNFCPMQVNSGNNLMDGKTTDAIPAALPSASMPSMIEMAVSPASVAPNGHFPFAPSDIQGISMDSSMLDPAFTSNVGTTGGLQMGLYGTGFSKDTLRSGGELTWNFSLNDLTADLTNTGDLGALGNYTGSPFLPDTAITLDTDQDGIVEKYFVDDIELSLPIGLREISGNSGFQTKVTYHG